MSQRQHFDCSICGQEGLREDDLRTHVLLEHEENAGSCPMCDLQHLTLEELNLHVNSVHSAVLSPGREECAEFSGCVISERQSESSFADGVEASLAEVEGKKILGVDSGPTNEPSDLCPSSDNMNVSTRSCACSFNRSQSFESNSPRDTDPNEQEYLNVRTTGNLDHIGVGRATSISGPVEDRNTSLTLERKRTRSEAKLSSSSASGGVVDVEDSVSTCRSSLSSSSSSSSSSAFSPFKKFVRLFSPKKSNKFAGKEAVNDAGRLSSGKGSDGTLSGDRDDDLSNPECPFCDISGLDAEAMAHHVECKHQAVLTSPDPAWDRPAQNGHSWNTSMIQKPRALPSAKPTLLSLSKEAQHLPTLVTCPICGLGKYDSDVLTSHINTEHLTPNDTDEPLTPGPRQTTPQASTCLQDVDAGPSTSTDSRQSSCPVCGISALDVTLLNDHVESHFEDKGEGSFSGDRQLAKQLAEEERQLQERRQRETFKQLQAKYGMDEVGSYKQQSEQDLETAVVRGQITVADYNQQRTGLRRSLAIGVDDGKSRTPGLIQKMVTYYTDQMPPGLSYVRLCCDTDHFSSTYGDKGWGCGYRNLQILLSSLVRIEEYRRVLFSGQNAIPSISKLQQLIESAWAKGFDPEGREQLGGRVANSRKWIGATEISALLSSLRAKCRLVDFHTPSGPRGTHPAMFQWVREYFGAPAPPTLRLRSLGGSGLRRESVQTGKTPLYLQHEGHSRTIVGCEVHKDNSVRLLLFDPSYKVNAGQGLGSAKLDGYAMRPVKKCLTQMKAKQYQIVSVDRLMTSEQEYERSKVLRSERKS